MPVFPAPLLFLFPEHGYRRTTNHSNHYSSSAPSFGEALTLNPMHRATEIILERIDAEAYVHSVFEAFRVPYWLTTSSDLALLHPCSVHACSGQCP